MSEIIDESAESAPPKPISPRIRQLTKSLIIVWALISAYAFVNAVVGSLSGNFDLRTLLATIVPLAAVWAAFDRKRWGRMTLIFVSYVAWLGYIVTLVYTGATGRNWMLDYDAKSVLYTALEVMWNGSAFAGFVGLSLAAVSLHWLQRNDVSRDFNEGKKMTLSPGQRIIAIALTFCWLYAMLFLPMLPIRDKAQKGPVDRPSQLESSSVPILSIAANP